jgi:hypothetical protein
VTICQRCGGLRAGNTNQPAMTGALGCTCATAAPLDAAARREAIAALCKAIGALGTVEVLGELANHAQKRAEKADRDGNAEAREAWWFAVGCYAQIAARVQPHTTHGGG